MPSLRQQLEKQAQEIKELKQQRTELRRLNLLLEGEPAMARLKEQLRDAKENARRVEVELERKEVVVEALRDETKHEVEMLKEELKYTEKQGNCFREETKHARDESSRRLRESVHSATRELASMNEALNYKQHAAGLNQQLTAAK